MPKQVFKFIFDLEVLTHLNEVIYVYRELLYVIGVIVKRKESSNTKTRLLVLNIQVKFNFVKISYHKTCLKVIAIAYVELSHLSLSSPYPCSKSEISRKLFQ